LAHALIPHHNKEQEMKLCVARIFITGVMLGAMPVGAIAAETCGLIKTLTGSARVERGAQLITAVVGLPIEPNDRVVTNAGGSVGITLKDDTLLAMGSGSALTVENFAFNQTTLEGNIAVRMTAGALRVVTGLIAKHSPPALKVITPNAVVGVRGTDFIVEVPAND
jgi:hypothetical protein